MSDKKRGVRQIYNYGDSSLSITELLEKPEVTNYLEQGKTLTYASLREKLRGKLKRLGDNLKDTVDRYNLENPVDQEQQRQEQRDTLYGAQRVKAGLPKKDTRGLVIGGERLTARQALEKYPQLKEELQKRGKISEKSLHAKYRAWMKKGKITPEMLGPPFEVVKVGANANAKFTTYFDSYTIKVNRYPVEPLDVFRRAIDTTISERGLVTGDKIRLITISMAGPTSRPFSGAGPTSRNSGTSLRTVKKEGMLTL